MILSDQIPQVRLGFSRKDTGKNHDGSQCTGFTVEPSGRMIIVAAR
jgi:hypothetical protein